MSSRFDLIVHDGMVVTSGGRAALDLGIAEGRFAAIAPHGGLIGTTAEEVDAAGLLVLPGIIDGHVHFREPGLEHEEDWESGSQAAVAGGVTTVLEMPNTVPPTATADLVRQKLALAQGRAWCDFGLLGLVGAGHASRVEAELRAMADAGVVGFKAFLGPSTGELAEPDDDSLESAMSVAAELGLVIAVHAEDGATVRAATDAVRATGRTDALAHLAARPIEAEVAAIERVGRLAARTGARVHLLHLTSRDGLATIERWRGSGARLTCELTPHHAFLDASDLERLGSLLRVNPPVRDAGHAEALLTALAGGRIDAIATDHAPHRTEDKLTPDIWATLSGFSGVELSLRLFLTRAVERGRMTLERYVEASSEAPARIWGLWPAKGAIAVGSDADLVIVDPDREDVIEAARLHGKNDLGPWEGVRTRGAAVATIVRGALVMRGGELVGRPEGRAVRAA